MSGRYVETKAIKSAVSGHELAVLGVVGIAWTGKQTHIDCPYSDHSGSGQADWRWDERKKVAFCTCIGRRVGEKGAHTVFDVVMVKTGVDFDDAKIAIAEMISRSDLIISNDFQKTDPDSLLAPAAANHDDGLVWAYLGHRLGIDPDQVPRPCTPVAGLQSLGYFDPPAKSGGKPILVDTVPCAIFGQVDREGGRHAHRIYLAPGGRGKANLGVAAGGKPRNPKKSAKNLAEQSTAGRSVLWGNADTATLAIIAEGIETAAAVALAFFGEINDGNFLVAACISANGVEAFRPWPATTRVIVAADRDEVVAESTGRPPPGERAARMFCLRAKEPLIASIALPGAAGEKVDWLDILRRDGIEAVRQGILDAVKFEPTDAESDADQEHENRVGNIERIAKLYPLPLIEGMRLSYRATRDGSGVAIYKYAGKDRDGNQRWERKCTPIGVLAQLRMANADTYGLRVVVEDMRGEPRALDFERGELARMSAADIRARLFDAGLRVEDDGEQIAVQILKAAAPTDVITIVSRPGWHYLPGLPDPIFVSPAGDVFGAADQNKIELAIGARLAPDVAKAGTFDGWLEAITAATEVESCFHWTLGPAAGFAGPIVSLTKLDTCGINLSGDTSLGKTTAQKQAVSAWSSPASTDRGLLRSMRATENAVEGLAQASNGTVLALDEMAHADGRAIGRTIYSLAGNVGKTRMRADATMRQSYAWSTYAVLSGESSLQDKIQGDGGQWTGGMAVRFLDIDLTGVSRKVDADRLDRLGKFSEHYGHAGPEFVRKMVECGLHRDPPILKEKILKAARALAGTGAESASIRAAIPLALLLVAGQLAQQFGILPTTADIRQAVTCAWQRYVNSSGAMVLDPEEQAIDELMTYVAEGWDVTIKHIDQENTNNREAHGWYDDVTVYLPLTRFREAIKGMTLKEQRLAKVLKDRGMLSRTGGADRIAVKYVPTIGPTSCYALTRKHFGRGAIAPNANYNQRSGAAYG